MEKNTKIFSTIVGLIVFFWGLASGYTTLSNNCTKNTEDLTEQKLVVSKKFKAYEAQRKEDISKRDEMNDKIINMILDVKDAVSLGNANSMVSSERISNMNSKLNRILKNK